MELCTESFKNENVLLFFGFAVTFILSRRRVCVTSNAKGSVADIAARDHQQAIAWRQFSNLRKYFIQKLLVNGLQSVHTALYL